MQGKDQPLDNLTMKGSVYRRSHKHSVIAVLGDRAPHVSSRGSRFYNVDRWTLRVFVREMCKWAHENPGCIPTRKEITNWTNGANHESVQHREIVIANTPDHLTARVAMALTGGGYHEAFHTYYSCLRDLTVDEMCKMVLPRWARVPDWSKFYQIVQDWNNIVEDIRIERNGCIEFPGVGPKMYDLQDFIIQQEAAGLEQVRAHGGGKAVRGALSIITATFRDVGLGYNTDRQKDALAKYTSDDPEAVKFVLKGPLSALLHEVIALGPKDDTECVRIALDVIGVLYNNSSEQDPANDPNNPDHQPGEDHKVQCPKCKAPGNKLVVRPKSDGSGGKVPGKGILTCSVCGYQTELDVQPQPGKGKPCKADDTPRFEGFDKPEPSPQSDDASDDASDDQASGGKAGDEADGNESGESDDQASGGESDDEADGNESGESDGNESDGNESDDASSDSSDDTQDADDGNVGDSDSVNQSNTDADAKADGGTTGGGHTHEGNEHAGNDWSDIADAALEGAETTTGLKDNNSALEAAVGDAKDTEERKEGGVLSGEIAWNPYAPTLDEFLTVQPSVQGKDHDGATADRLYASVKSEAAFLRARLRQIVKAMEMQDVIHGVRKGRRLSARFLTDSRVALMGNTMPSRAYKVVDEAPDTSLAAAIVIDESGSMSSALRDATRAMIALTEPLDSLGCPVQVSGFRNGHSRRSVDVGDKGNYHRFANITHDVFKRFHEPFRGVKWRFANTRASGGTPMSDGIQFGLDALNERSEGHRILFVITDGQPNGGHMPIMKRQFRLAREAGIHVVGVGLGYQAKYVQTVFDDSVWTRHIEDMPMALIEKLNQIIDMRASKRGRRMRSTG